MVMVAGRLRTERDGSQLVLTCDSVKFLRPARRHDRGSWNTPDAAVGDMDGNRQTQEVA
jgi:hypothetical protein